MLKQLGDQDASFLYLETPETPQHVGGLSLVELPPGYQGDFYEDYKRHIASRLHLVPMLYMKLLPLPFDLDHPFWIEDGELDVDYHIRQLTLPRPGRMSQLEQLVGRLHSNFLDRSRPLWEFYVIDGLESGQVAIYTKIHHAAMDGASSIQLVTAMYDPTPAPRQLPPPPRKDGAPKSRVEIDQILKGVATHFLRQEIRALQFIPDVLKAWANLALPDAQTLKYDKGLQLPQITPKTLFNVGITSQRAYAARSMPLAALKKLARQTDTKLNDIVLALVSGALRRYLLDKDGLPKDPMTAMVPVSLHKPGDTEMSNQNYTFVCNLATHLHDPLERLAAICRSSTEQKKLISNVKNALLPDLSVIGSGTLMRGMVDLYSRAKLADRLPPMSNLTVSNVPGSPVPLYIAGAKVLTMYPCSIPFHGSALNVTVQSYADSLDFGLIACRRTVPDVAEFADHLTEALVELQQAVAQRAADQAAARSPQDTLADASNVAVNPPGAGTARSRAAPAGRSTAATTPTSDALPSPARRTAKPSAAAPKRRSRRSNGSAGPLAPGAAAEGAPAAAPPGSPAGKH